MRLLNRLGLLLAVITALVAMVTWESPGVLTWSLVTATLVLAMVEPLHNLWRHRKKYKRST